MLGEQGLGRAQCPGYKRNQVHTITLQRCGDGIRSLQLETPAKETQTLHLLHASLNTTHPGGPPLWAPRATSDAWSGCGVEASGTWTLESQSLGLNLGSYTEYIHADTDLPCTALDTLCNSPPSPL